VLALAGRARGLAVALVVLTLSAGAVLAGGDGPPAAADFGLETAGEASGQTVPVRADADALEDEEGDEGEEEALPEADEETDEAEAALEEADAWANHGAMVSEAAGMETPEGFDNHGAFVSCVAKMNRGQLGPDADLSELVLADLTPEDCDADAEDSEEAADADADATSASTAGPGRSGEAKTMKATRGSRGQGHGADR
jgi:hypothetical protein